MYQEREPIDNDAIITGFDLDHVYVLGERNVREKKNKPKTTEKNT